MRTLIPIVAAALVASGCTVPSLPSMPGASLFGSKPDDKPAAEPVAAEAKEGSRSAVATQTSTCRHQSNAQDRAEGYVAQIRTTFSGAGAAAELGSGLLMAVKSNVAYVLTARHVVHKDRAGAPNIQVLLNAVGQSRPARVSPKFPPPAPPYADLAVIEVDLGGDGARAFAEFEWKILRDQADAFDTRDFVIIGNPAGRGLNTTNPGPAEAKAHEIRVNSGVMEPGYSGGGIFDQHRRLVGIATDDGGQFAVGYPIESALRLMAAAGVPMDLRQAPKPRPGVHLASIDAKPDALAGALHSGLRAALSKGGYDPDCMTSASYRLLVTAQGWQESGTTTHVSLKPSLLLPNGGQMTLDEERISLIHFFGQSPLNSSERIAERSGDAIASVVKKLEDALRKQESLGR